MIEARSQLFVDQSLIHWIQSRPNIGLEYRRDKLAFNLNYIRHRNIWVGLGTHLPSLIPVNQSKRLALGYKYFIIPNLFFENKIDYLNYSAPFLIKGLDTDLAFNDNREIKLQNNLGVLMGRKKKLQFSLQAGYHIGKGAFQIPIRHLYQQGQLDAYAYLSNGESIYIENYDSISENKLKELLQDYSNIRVTKHQFNIDFKLYFRLTGKRKSVDQ
ncbi:hypothetical protein [Jiulongibacter sp. NS-SX5]|uniref:hypothetical protein n=1 Tax=Jiulongibacter sp. NS-SX5 TaxID=3463854 RepID=UPI00405A39E4